MKSEETACTSSDVIICLAHKDPDRPPTRLLDPPTFTGCHSRYLLTGDVPASTRERYAFAVCERAFKDLGLPTAIRTDDGVPFVSTRALFGLSKLSVWWLRLGIDVETIQPGQPQQNGRHERMHLTRK